LDGPLRNQRYAQPIARAIFWGSLARLGGSRFAAHPVIHHLKNEVVATEPVGTEKFNMTGAHDAENKPRRSKRLDKNK